VADNKDNLDDFEGLSPLEEDAAHMHEMFIALEKAGFQERQALQLIAFLIDRSDEENDVHIHIDGDMIKGDLNLDNDEDEDNL
jgi:hypothetical protein